MIVRKIAAGAMTVVGVIGLSASASFAGSGHVTDYNVKESKVTICIDGTYTTLVGEQLANLYIGYGIATKGTCSGGVE